MSIIAKLQTEKQRLISALKRAVRQRNFHHDCGYPEACQCISSANAELASLLAGEGEKE